MKREVLERVKDGVIFPMTPQLVAQTTKFRVIEIEVPTAKPKSKRKPKAPKAAASETALPTDVDPELNDLMAGFGDGEANN